MGNNAVGPVALIAAGIYLGYLTITGRAANFAAFLATGGQSVAPPVTQSGTVQNAVTTTLSTKPGSSAAGDGTAAQTGSYQGLLPAGAPGTAAGMSAAQAANAAQQILNNYSFPSGN